MKKVLVILPIILFNTLQFSQGLYDVCSPTQLNIYAVGSNGLTQKSTNAGATYSSTAVGSSTLYSVCGFSANVWSVGNGGAYNKSADNGISWSSQVIAGGSNLKSIYFVDSLTGFIAGANGLILKSSDGGNNWISLSSGTINNLTKVKFIDASTGYLLGENNFFAKTTNAGLNWNPVSLPVNENVTCIDSYNNTILLGMENSGLLISNNSGSNWNSITLKIYSRPSVKSVHLINETSFVLFLESGSIWNTTNTGASFSYIQNPMLSPISSCAFNDVRGYAVSGNHNAVLRTANNGLNWALPSGTTSNIIIRNVLGANGMSYNKILDINYQKRGVVYACQQTRLMRSLNYGENWTLLSTLPYAAICQQLLVSMKDSSKMIVAMNTGSDTVKIFRTTNYGLNWQQTYKGNADYIGNLVTQSPANPDTLYLGIRDSVMRSTNFGLNWVKIADGDFNDWCDIAVNSANPNIIYSSTNGRPAKVYKSTNYGANWFMIDFVVDTSFCENPCIATTNLNPNVIFHAQFGYSANQRGLKRSFSNGNTWLFTIFEGTSWAVDIAKDDPNLVAYGNVSYTPIYISINSGTNFIASPNSWAEQLLYYDRSNLFATNGSLIMKLRVDYQMPVIGIQQVSSSVPGSFALKQNYPNPFNPVTNIAFDLPERSAVKLSVFDVMGRELSVLVNEVLTGGSYKADWDASQNSSGVYFYRIETQDFSETKKMILLK